MVTIKLHLYSQQTLLRRPSVQSTVFSQLVLIMLTVDTFIIVITL